MRLRISITAFLLVLTVASSFASTPGSAQTYPTYSFSLKGVSMVSCWYWGVLFDAAPGERFKVKWTETVVTPTSLDLYIAPASSIHEIWFCDSGPVGPYSNSGALGSANWAAPSGGEYVVVLVNNNYGSVSGTLSITAANATVAASSIGYATARQEPICLGNDCSRA